MSFTETLQEPAKEPKKPVILCDVGDTLLIGTRSNQELITLLNHSKANGFEVRIITGAYDSGTWETREKIKLQGTNLEPGIIKNAGGKRDINASTYSNVVAIIDDRSREPYIGEVLKKNPDAKHFDPLYIDNLTKYLTRIKTAGMGPPSA